MLRIYVFFYSLFLSHTSKLRLLSIKKVILATAII